MSSATSTASLPSGMKVLVTFPDALFIPEIVFGGLVWILVGASKVQVPMLQGWVMFVSVSCFSLSVTLLCFYMFGVLGGSSFWVTMDVIWHEIAALFYLSAAVLEAYYTYGIKDLTIIPEIKRYYQENVAAVVFAFVATLLYVIHKVGSLMRWKSA